MKTFNYRGMTFEVEDHFKYIATDADGEIWLYVYKPVIYDDHWIAGEGEYRKLITVENWENSLENI